MPHHVYDPLHDAVFERVVAQVNQSESLVILKERLLVVIWVRY